MIQHALASELLLFEEEYGLITISSVEVFSDLSQANIFISATRSVKRLVEKCNAQSGRLKKNISPLLTQKRTPSLVFHLDLGSVAAKKIDALLEK